MGTAFEAGVCGQDLWEAVQEFVEKEWGITLYDAIEVMKDVDWRAEEWLKNLPRCCPNMDLDEDGICLRCGRSVEETPGLKEAWEKGPLA